MDFKVFLRGNETFDDFYKRCNNLTLFNCSEEEMLWWMMGSRRLPLSEIVPISIVLVVIFLTGMVGNVCVCVVIVKQPGLHTATNYYLFSLAVSDLLLLLFGLPNDLSVYWHQYPYSLGLVFCKLRALISEAATYVSVLTISAFSLERYLAICHPLHLYAMAGLTRACRIIVILWVISVLCAAPFALYTDISYRDYPPNSGNLSMDSAFCALMAPSPLLELSSIFFFFVPAVLILCLYVRMGLHIRSTQVIEKSKSLLNGHVHGETRQAKSRKAIIRMLAAVVIAFFVCWAPFHVQRLFYIYGYELPQFLVINEHLFNVAGALYYVSATVNPILYNVMSGRYRIAFQETLLCRKIERRDSRATTFDLTSCRDTPLPSYSRSLRQKRESRIAFISKVDFIKEDPSPFCADEEAKAEETVIYFYNEKKVHLEIEEVAGSNVAGAAAGKGRDFPPGFRFGAASASYQVEGAWNHSDKSESIWDRMSHSHPELIKGGASGDVACDSFHQWQADVDLAAQLGLHFYRFSISWPRLLPTAFADKVSEEGARYYNDLIDGLVARGVEPVVTLYHWDLPQRLQDLGGWTNPLIADWFADYARVAYNLFGDRVKVWITINEPIIVCDCAYISSIMAPGIRDPDVAPHICTKNLLLAHAKAYRIYDTEFRSKYNGKVSLANHAVWYEPESDSAEDAEVAELAMQMQEGRYSHAIFGAGGWPSSVERLVADNSKRDGHPRSRLPSFTQEEIDFIKGTFDFYGLNHYTSRVVKPAVRKPWSERSFWPLAEWPELPVKMGVRPEWPSGDNSWLKVNPSGLKKLLVWLKQQYGDVPILITENGYPTGSGLEDDQRVQYYELYLEAVLEAIREGVNVTGYTAWTLLDNFEWLDGYETKFGLFEVDFSDPLRPRTARRSAHYYASVIKHHSLDVPETARKEEL